MSFRIQWGGPEVYEFRKGDILTIDRAKYPSKEEYGLVIERRNKTVFIKRYPLESSNNKYMLVGKVVKRERVI